MSVLTNYLDKLTARLEFTQKKNGRATFQVKKEKKLKAVVQAIEDDLLNADEVSAKLIELADRSRRYDLRIDGIKEDPNEP